MVVGWLVQQALMHAHMRIASYYVWPAGSALHGMLLPACRLSLCAQVDV